MSEYQIEGYNIIQRISSNFGYCFDTQLMMVYRFQHELWEEMRLQIIWLHINARCSYLLVSYADVRSSQANTYWPQRTASFCMFFLSFHLLFQKKSFFLFNSDAFNITSSEVEVVVGTNEWQTGGSRYNVSNMIVHEQFELSDYINDIALLHTQSPIEFNERVQPINFTSNAVEPNTLLQITGMI